MSLTDARKMWKLLNDAGTNGYHSHDLRAGGVSGNPSQRAKDIVSKGVPVFTARERRGKRPGSRYWLAPFAPDFSTPVAPNAGAPEPEPEPRPKPHLTLVLDYTGDEPAERWEAS